MGLIPDDVIGQVIDRTDIAELIAGYIPLKKAGRNFKALCPFHHEKTPSFVVTPDKQIFHCFGCGVGGNALSFVMKHERIEFVEAVKLLAAKAGIVIHEDRPVDKAKEDLRQAVARANAIAVEYFHENLISGKEDEVRAAREYLKGRKIGSEFAKQFFIGYAYDSWDGLTDLLRKKGLSDLFIEKSGLAVRKEGNNTFYDRFRGRVIFPIFDQRGRPVAFGARALKKEDKAKYINSSETPLYVKGQHLYGFNWAKDAVTAQDCVIIVEGYLDFLRPFHAGVHNIVASLGTALTHDQVRLIRRYTKNVVMLFDMDTAGQMATLRSLDLLLEEDMNVRVAMLAEDEDPDSFILKYGVALFKKSIDEAQGLFDFKLKRLMTQYNAKTIEGRGKICQEIIPTIDKIPSEVVRDGYTRELAGRLNVKEDVILKERQRILGKITSRGVGVQENSQRAGKKAVHTDENCLLKLMLLDPKWVAAARQTLAPEELKDPMVRLIIEKAYELLSTGKEVDAASLVTCFDDEGMRSFVTASAQEDGTVKGDRERIFKDCLGRIRSSRQKTERQRILEEIQVAEKSGDSDKVRQFQNEFNTLIKQR
ncbi:MAG: DNA primase [Candidatus Omnitrophica bacterium]|nr:DNA primase [Candidatus Omnitrophota bacterium]